MAFLPNLPVKLWLYLAAVVAVLFFVTWSYTYTYNEGKKAERIEQLKADVEAYKKREGIENEVHDMDNSRICIELGGLPDECNELRRMEAATQGK